MQTQSRVSRCVVLLDKQIPPVILLRSFLFHIFPHMLSGVKTCMDSDSFNFKDRFLCLIHITSGWLIHGYPKHSTSSAEVIALFIGKNEWKLIYFPLSRLQKLLATSQKFCSVFPQLRASFANTLLFSVCHFLGMPKSQMYLTRHCLITVCAIALFQAGSSCTGTDSTLSTCGV